jgi:hypothetical protein
MSVIIQLRSMGPHKSDPNLVSSYHLPPSLQAHRVTSPGTEWNITALATQFTTHPWWHFEGFREITQSPALRELAVWADASWPHDTSREHFKLVQARCLVTWSHWICAVVLSEVPRPAAPIPASNLLGPATLKPSQSSEWNPMGCSDQPSLQP